jgi:hypothetical protein
MASDKTIVRAMEYLAAATPWLNRMPAEQKSARMDVARDQWADIDDNLLMSAVRQSVSEMTSDKDTPGIGTIRNKALDLMNRAHGAEIAGADAWGYVQAAMSGLGRDTDAEVLQAWLAKKTSEPVAQLMMVVIRRFGWVTMCNTHEDDLPTMRAQFRNAFDAQMARERSRQLMTPQVEQVITQLAQTFNMNDKLLRAPAPPSLRDEAGL